MDELNLSWDNPYTLLESFKLTGNSDDINDYLLANEKFNPIGVEPPIGQEYTGEVDCPDGCFLNWWEINGLIAFMGCTCPPVDPIEITEAEDCACLNTNVQRPSGCVKVEDTEKSTSGNIGSYKGVREVKIILKDSWFTEGRFAIYPDR